MKMIMLAEHSPERFFLSFNAPVRFGIAMTAADVGSAGLDASGGNGR